MSKKKVSAVADRPNPQVISLNAVRWNKAYRRLYAGLQTFCEDRLDDEPWAEDEFFGFQPEDEEAEEFHAAFVDWVAFDYRDWDGVTMLEHYRAEAGPWDPTEERMLDAWKGARIGLYRVLEDLEHVVRLQSCLTGDEFHVQREEDLLSFDAGDLAICRLLPVGDGFRFGFDVRTCPADAEPVIMQALERELARHRRQLPGAGWDDMFAERWPLVHDAISEAIITRSVLPLDTPATPPSRGLSEPPADASAFEREVAGLLEAYLEDEDVMFGERRRAARLWWDAAAAVAPRSGKAQSWAAGAAYAFLHYAIADETTQADVAEAFDVSVSTVASRAKEIAAALTLTELDDRYADPLDPRVRFHTRSWVEPFDFNATVAAALAPEEAAAEAAQVIPWMTEGQAMLETGQLAQAREKFMQALELMPDAAPVRNMLAMTYVVGGQPDQAIACALPVLKIDPHCVQTLALLAICYTMTGDHGQARQYALQAASSHRRARSGAHGADPEELAADLQLTVEALAVTESHADLLRLLRDEPREHLSSQAVQRAVDAAVQLGRPKEATFWRTIMHSLDR